MRVARYIAKRLLYIGPQLFGIILVSFLLVKLIPGDPAVLMLGPFARRTSSRRCAASSACRAGAAQFWIYVGHLVHGDLGTSWQTTQPVVDDLLQRFPATLELITCRCCWPS